jgi:hypothetical protein
MSANSKVWEAACHADLAEKHFYHSFPRIRPGDSDDRIAKVGLEILKSIRQIGLVLAPEIVVWKQALKDGQDRTTRVRQSRICLTELSRNQVEEHGKQFGPFSLQLRIDALRQLGAFPVIYVPQRLKADRKFSTAGETIVAEIADIKYTINQLCGLSRLVPNGNSTVSLQNTDGADKVVASYQVPLKTINDILSYIGYRNAPFDLMVGVLSHLQSLFYPTDDEIHDKQMQYYRQREWRLVAGLVLEGEAQSRPLTNVEKHMLLTIDNRFWSKEVSDGKTSLRRIDDACVISRFEGKDITDAICAVIVPVGVYEEAKGIFGDKVVMGSKSMVGSK